MDSDNSDALFVVQARYGSERLPGKVLKDLSYGLNVMNVLQRVLPVDTVWAVPDCDKGQFEILISRSMWYGEEDNVLRRLQEAAGAYVKTSHKYIVRICADNAFLSEDLIGRVLAWARHYDQPYTNNEFDPKGCFIEVIDREAFFDIDESNHLNIEHVTASLRAKPFKSIPPMYPFPKDFSMALDTPADLARIRGVFAMRGDGLPTIHTLYRLWLAKELA